MMGIGIMCHQVIAKQNGKTVKTWPLTGDYATAVKNKQALEREELEYKNECEMDGREYVPAVYSIFSADADFFA